MGFIYAVAQDEVLRLNPTGLDVLKREGQWPIEGDVVRGVDVTASFFQDITVNRDGIYHVLDSSEAVSSPTMTGEPPLCVWLKRCV